jgi:hypothetical protein
LSILAAGICLVAGEEGVEPLMLGYNEVWSRDGRELGDFKAGVVSMAGKHKRSEEARMLEAGIRTRR